MAKDRNKKKMRRISSVTGSVEPLGPSGPGVGDVIAGDAGGIGLPDSFRRNAASDAPEVPGMGAEHRLDPQASDEELPGSDG